MFFTYHQNNSDGYFDYDKKKGITVWVIIEAKNAEQANKRAEQIGLYFDGVGVGDCPCCGDKWYSAYSDDDGTNKPEIYGEPVSKVSGTKWIKKGKDIAVHYLNGKIEWFDVKHN